MDSSSSRSVSKEGRLVELGNSLLNLFNSNKFEVIVSNNSVARRFVAVDSLFSFVATESSSEKFSGDFEPSQDDSSLSEDTTVLMGGGVGPD